MMATKIYESRIIKTIDGDELYLTPLKIKYLREFMEVFNDLSGITDQDKYVDLLVDCVRISMKQYKKDIKTKEDVEDSFDLETIYSILEIAAGISLKQNSEESQNKIDPEESDASWDTLKLAELESEVFLLGIWKDYEELEESLSMPEITATLNAKRENDYNEKKFLAAIQGIDLDKQSGKEDAWEKMKAKVFSRGNASDPNDVTALTGYNAQKAGFGIGMGLEYERL